MTLGYRTLTARRLRSDSTDAERIAWRASREFRADRKFRRQHPIGRYIADFAGPEAKLVIELDGGRHAAQQSDDLARTTKLASHGDRVVRALGEHPTSPRPSPPRRAEREKAE